MMFCKISKSLKPERFLVVSLSNIGDVVLTLPVIDLLHEAYPSARINVMVGPKAAGLLKDIPWIDVVVLDKKMPWRMRWAWFLNLRRLRFDLVIDLRNSMLPFLLNARVVTLPSMVKDRVHMRQKHLDRLASVMDISGLNPTASCFPVHAEDIARRVLKGINEFVVVALGAADERKRWPEDNFLTVIKHLRAKDKPVVLLGDKHDAMMAVRLVDCLKDSGIINLCGQTALDELMSVVCKASMALTNDSGIMHLLSYADKPVVALFGPTDPYLYGPWSKRSVAIRKGNDMASISTQEVIVQLDKLL